MSKILKVIGGAAAAATLLVIGGAVAATVARDARLDATVTTHTVEFPIPFPLSADELATLRAERLAALPPAEPAPADASAPPPADPLDGVDLTALALERAVARGAHLAASRYACVECHGKDLGGGTMFDDPMVGTAMGPNLTRGEGSVTRDYTAADWDRIVRHGVKKDGHPTIMPSEDFLAMSDRELSDLIAWIRSQPDVDRVQPPVSFGPLGTVLIAAEQIRFSASKITDHQGAHAVEPPQPTPDATFGKHLAQVCTGCHGLAFAGGPIPGAPPDWAPSANLTPHADGLQGWSFDQFKVALQTGVKPDGAPFRAPMDLNVKFAARMTEVELQALWAFLQTLPPAPGN